MKKEETFQSSKAGKLANDITRAHARVSVLILEDEMAQIHRDEAKKYLKLANHFLELSWAAEKQKG